MNEVDFFIKVKVFMFLFSINVFRVVKWTTFFLQVIFKKSFHTKQNFILWKCHCEFPLKFKIRYFFWSLRANIVAVSVKRLVCNTAVCNNTFLAGVPFTEAWLFSGTAVDDSLCISVNETKILNDIDKCLFCKLTVSHQKVFKEKIHGFMVNWLSYSSIFLQCHSRE